MDDAPHRKSTSSSMSPNSTHSKSHRVLACVLCQHRKIKCDRNTPCSNCIKANVTCTPSTPAPARKRRRPNQDLQERLARCEQLLKQYAAGSAPSPATEGLEKTSVINVSQLAMQPSQPLWSVSAGNEQRSLPQLDAQVACLDPQAQRPTPPTALTQPRDLGAAQPEWKPAGRVVVEDGSVRFVDSYLWARIHDQLQAMREIVESDDMEEQSVLGSDAVTPDDNIDLLLNDVAAIDLEDVQPDPLQVFRLWQIYLERVNPITKVIHVPSLQPSIVDAAANHSAVSNNIQALLFGIYSLAVISMSDSESLQMLGIEKEEALRRFTAGVKAALTKINFLKNHDMTTLQALVLYLLSLQGRYNRHAAWVFSGVLIRIAQKMGLHRDGELLGLKPFETEMRRRLWWQIIMLDSKHAMTSGFSETLLPLSWDTKLPRNVNDADLFPGSTDPIQPRKGPTEMVFCLLAYEIGLFILKNNGVPGIESALFANEKSQVAASVKFATFREQVDQLEARLNKAEAMYCDPSLGGIHLVASKIRTMVVSKIKAMMVPMHEQPEWGTEIHNVQDNIFKLALTANEHNVIFYREMDKLGFLWQFKLHFQIEVFAAMIGQLRKKPTGSLVDRAWKLIDEVYHYHEELNDTSQRQHAALATFVIKAWQARERALQALGMPYDTPICIPRLQSHLPQLTHSDSSSSVGLSPPQGLTMETPHAQPDSNMDQLLGGFMDTSGLDWDTWVELGGSNLAAQTSAAVFGGFGVFTPQANW